MQPVRSWSHVIAPRGLATAARVLALGALLAAPAGAQGPAGRTTGDSANLVVRGTVVDERGRALPGAEVTAPEHPVVRTDASGTFVLTLPSSRLPLMVAVRQVGFSPDSVRLDRGTTALRVVLRPLATTLGAVVVTAKASEQKLIDNGFYRRQRTTHGRHLDAEALRGYAATGLIGIVRDTPRLTVRRTNTDDYAFGSIGGRPCRMNIFIDGRFERAAMPSPQGIGKNNLDFEGIGLRGVIPFDAIYALEVYPSAASVPTQFARVGPNAGQQGRGRAQIPLPAGMRVTRAAEGDEMQSAECGAIVIWTKEPEAQAARP